MRDLAAGEALGNAYNWPAKHELAAFEKLNTWYYSDAPLTVQPLLDEARRETTFDEVVKGLDETNALYGVCPDNAVLKLGPGKRFQFNYDYCKGCGMCAAECPCGAVQMVAETV